MNVELEDTNLPATPPPADAVTGAALYEALTGAAGICELEDRVIVRVTGDDRVSFLHGMCSNDIKNLKAGGVMPALFLTEHAHVIADFYAWAEPDAILIETGRTLWPRVREHLEKFLVADDVEMDELGAVTLFDAEGPGAAELIGRVAGEVPAPGRCVTAAEVKVANLARFGRLAFTLLVAKDRVSDVTAKIVAAGGARGVAAVSRAALEILRIESGVARIGVDTGDKTIALEARLGQAISYSKGCYIGQETIERASAHGSLKKRLQGLRITGDRLPLSGAGVIHQGKEVGKLTSVARSPRFGVIGLSILHHSVWTPGEIVTIRDADVELAARVSELPFD